jgi:hypothetical protein
MARAGFAWTENEVPEIRGNIQFETAPLTYPATDKKAAAKNLAAAALYRFSLS